MVTLATVSCSYDTKEEKAVKGVLKINEIEASLIHPVIDITGQWEFYKDKFYRLSELPEEKNYVEMPYSWKGTGYGTYYIKIIQPKSDAPKVLVLEYIKSSCRVYINDKLVKEIGKVGTSREKSKPEGGIDFVELPKTKIVNVIIHVSNYYHEIGGINKKIKITSYQGFSDYKELRLSIRVAVCAALAAFILNLLILAVYLKKKRITLWFALQFSIILAFNILYIPGINIIDKGIDEELNIRLLILIVYLNPIIWIKIFKEFFGRYCPDIAVKILTFIFAGFFLLGLSLDLLYLYQATKIYQFAVYGTLIFFLYVNMKAIIKGYPVARWYLSAILFIMFSFMFDGMVYAGIIESRVSMIPISSLIFVLLVTAGTFRVYAKAFDLVEKQGNELSLKLMEVERLNEEKKMALEIKDEFLQRTSHELKSPLNGIIGMVEMMMEGESGNLNQAAINQLAIIGYSGKRLKNMINNVIDASKIKLNEIGIEAGPVNLNGVLEVVKKLSSRELKKRNIELKISIPEGLDVLGDEDKINQIFLNLVDNAMRHSEASQIVIEQINLNEPYISIIVSDNGAGIPEDKRDKIFEKYEQLGGKRNSSGSGLGLYISKGLCQIHGGDLRLLKREEAGSGFVVTLKKSEVEAKLSLSKSIIKENRHLVIPSEPIEIEKEGKQKIFTIWVVDDDHVNLILLKQLLSKYELRTFIDSKEMLEELKYRKPSLILLDVVMPVVCGYDICKEIRLIYNYLELPVIFLTSNSRSRDVVEGFMAGGNDYMMKPIERNVMISRIRSQLTISLTYKRWVELRGYSNKISEFKSTFDMVTAVFDLLKQDPAVVDIIVFEDSRKIKKLASGNIRLKDVLQEEPGKEIYTIKYEGKNYIMVDMSEFSEYRMLIEFMYEPDGIDVEYLKNAFNQMKATKRNITSLLSQPKIIEAVSDIQKRLPSIRYIKSAGNYCLINYKAPGEPKLIEETIRITINSIRLYLGDETLVQIHKGCLINKGFVRGLKKGEKRKIAIDVDGEMLPVGITFKKAAEAIANSPVSAIFN